MYRWALPRLLDMGRIPFVFYRTSASFLFSRIYLWHFVGRFTLFFLVHYRATHTYNTWLDEGIIYGVYEAYELCTFGKEGSTGVGMEIAGGDTQHKLFIKIYVTLYSKLYSHFTSQCYLFSLPITAYTDHLFHSVIWTWLFSALFSSSWPPTNTCLLT